MICKKCNQMIDDNAVFCPVCGASQLEEPVGQEQAATEQPVIQEPEQTAGEQPAIQNLEQTTEEQPVMQESEQAATEQPAMQGQDQMMAEQPIMPEQNQAAFSQTLQQPNMQPGFQFNTNTTESGKKSKKKIIIPAAIGVGVAAVGLVGFFMKDKILNLVNKNFQNPTEYYQQVEGDHLGKNLDIIEDRYGRAMERMKSGSFGESVTMKVELGSTLKSLLASYAPEASSLDSAAIRMGASVADNAYTLEYAADVNDQQILSCDLFMDLSDLRSYIKVPELSESYLDLSSAIESVKESSSETMTAYTKCMELMPETKELTQLLKNCTETLYKGMGEATREDAKLEAAGVSAKYTKLSVSADGKALKNIIKDELQVLKEDDMINNLLKDVEEMSDQSVSGEYSSSMDTLINQIEGADASSFDGTLNMDVYVDDEGEIAGREIKFNYENREISYHCLNPQSGGKMGTDFAIAVDGKEYLTLTGSGDVSNAGVSGSYTLTANGSEKSSEIQFTTKDFGVSEDGYLSGTISLSIPEYSGYVINATFDQNQSTCSVRFALEVSGEEWAAVNVVVEESDALSFEEPGDSDVVYDAIDNDQVVQYTQELLSNTDTIAEKLSDATGMDVEQIKELLQSAVQSLQDEISNTSLNAFNSGADEDDWEDYDTEDYDTEDYDTDEYDTEDYDTEDYDWEDNEIEDTDWDDYDTDEYDTEDYDWGDSSENSEDSF